MANNNVKPGKYYYHDFCGACACITVRRDGSALLSWSAGGHREKSEHKNFNAARAKWYRLNN